MTQLLGSGGFADVYLGEHLYLGSEAAIKLLHTRVARSEMPQIQQEGRMLAVLLHPAIVRVLEFGIEDSNPYLVMDYAPGGTLRSRHPKGECVELSTVVEYAKQVGQALQYAHDQRVIHRDVKPENMLIGRHGEILLSDFGVALIAQSSHSSTKDMAGTIAYMAPEQIQAHPRAASDQYALGIVVYEWLCGQRPFNGSFFEIAAKHSLAPVPGLREHLPTLSPAVEQVILTALKKSPEERFASVRAFIEALLQTSQQTGIMAYSNSVAKTGVMFGFDAAHTHVNPYEHVLSVANVSGLRQTWVAATGSIIRSSPAVANGMVYVGSADHKLYALDAVTGEQKWVVATSAKIESSPAVANGMVYVGSFDHKLYALDAVTGEQK